MPYETKDAPLLPRHLFAKRVLKGFGLASFMIGGSLGLGTLGYMDVAHMTFVDALYNASMILTGMGPVDHLVDPSAKLFASGYALFSGIAFLSSVGVLVAPIVHRFMHKLHMDATDDEDAAASPPRRVPPAD
jgi:hypothetical protein